MFNDHYCYDTLERTVGDLYETIRRVRDSAGTVLIQGKSGTGKEAVCNLLNTGEAYKGKPVVAINCAAIPESLMEAELFGYESGAFTGAENQQIGKLEAAGEGTLILDEISEMSLAVQAKLLRVLESREFYRLGGSESVKFQARIMATTNRRLADVVEEGKFRSDLYYRLDVLRLDVPDLSMRTRDIPLLVDNFLDELALANDKHVRLSPEVYYFLCNRNWEGNLRELKNFVTRLYYLADDNLVTINDLNRNDYGIGREAASNLPFFTIGTTMPLEQLEKKYILQTLSASQGNKSRAARILQISLKTLRNKLKGYQLEISG